MLIHKKKKKKKTFIFKMFKIFIKINGIVLTHL